MFRRLSSFLFVCAAVLGAHAASAQVGPTPQPSYFPLAVPIAGAVQRPLPAYFTDELNAKDFGAVCDGTTDDGVALQNAITAAAGTARLKIGNPGQTCVTDEQLAIPSNSQIVLDGTLMQGNGANNINPINISGANTVTIEGSGTINGNKTNVICGFQPCAGIGIDTSTNVWVRGITITNINSWPINATSGSNYYFSYITATNSGHSLECASVVNNCWMDHMTVNGTSDQCVSFYGGITNSGITNSTVSGCLEGIGIYSDAAQPLPSSHIIVANNIAIGSTQLPGGFGVYILNAAGTTATSGTIHDLLIEGNQTTGNASGGILVSAADGSPISNIDLIGNSSDHDGGTGTGAYNAGIYIGGDSGSSISYINVSSNRISDVGPGATNGVGIKVTNLSAGGYPNITISGNYIYDDQTTKSTAYGVSGFAGVNNVMAYNTFGTFRTLADNFSPVATTYKFNFLAGAINTGQNFVTSGTITGQTIASVSTITATNIPYVEQQGIYVSGAVTPSAGTVHTATWTGVAVGTTDVALTFALAFGGLPACHVQNHAAGNVYVDGAPTVSGLNIKAAAAGQTADVTCTGHQ